MLRYIALRLPSNYIVYLCGRSLMTSCNCGQCWTPPPLLRSSPFLFIRPSYSRHIIINPILLKPWRYSWTTLNLGCYQHTNFFELQFIAVNNSDKMNETFSQRKIILKLSSYSIERDKSPIRRHY